ncbi:aspartate--tRNA ligase [Candidatus Woesearchaeota archaeon]|nr:aspartate--tRNA ligase [Candidatus Woesearchaeota archaeon]
MRTHTCGELNKKHVGLKVKLCGWVHSRRDHGGIIFIDLRDRYGLTQIVFEPKHNKQVYEQAVKLRNEWVVMVEGVVRLRPEGTVNEKLSTGFIEVLADKLEVLNKAEPTPIVVDEHAKVGENARLKYRYLDLRRFSMQRNIIKRHEFTLAVRKALASLGFVEIETPLLIRHTPEGARDYIVPSRLHPGKFYALPQSPQLYKQILMIAGFDRYFQIAKCLRDEDLRADRQPEFTQIDLEMSFVSEEDVFKVVETFLKQAIKECFGIDVKTPFPRITYAEAMDKYGTDKPDLRFGLQLVDVTSIVKNSDFEIFSRAEIVKALPVHVELSRKQIDELTSIAQHLKSPGLAWVKVENNALTSGIAKFLKPVEKELLEAMPSNVKVILFQAGVESRVNQVLAALRNKLGEMLNLYNKEELNFVWVVDFPLFAWDDENNKWDSEHHPFTGIKPGFEKFLNEDPGRVVSRSYDLVLNGWELGSGSVRLTNPELLKHVLKIIGLSESEAVEKFGFLMEAFKYGAPPHGGIALGLDRTVALLLGFNDIREVIAFPKNKAAQSPMDGSPSSVSEEQLRELHLKIVNDKND